MKSTFFKFFLISILFLSCNSVNDETLAGDNNANVVNNRQATGSSAYDLLANNNFNKIVIEFAYIEGYKPTANAKNNFKNFIESRVNKSQGVEFIEKEIPSTGKIEYTLNEIVDIEKEYRTQYNKNKTIAVWVLFVNGKSSNDTNSSAILGTAYWNTSFVIYEETIRELSNSTFAPERSLLETSVINHEFGHILGLTNLGSDLQSNHEDPNHPKHCINEDCLMYWAAETSQGIGSMLSSGQVPNLDSQCLEDLRANGGK